MNLIPKVLQLFNKKEKKSFYFLFILMLISTLFETIGIGLIVPFVAIVTNPKLIHDHFLLSKIYQFFHFQSNTGFLIFTTMVLLSVFFMKNLYLIYSQYIQYRFIFQQQIKLSKRLLHHYLTSQYEFHLQRNSSELLRNVNFEVPRIFNQVLIPILMIISELLVITGITILLIINSPIQTLISVVILGGCTGIFLRLFRNKLNKIGKKQQKSNGEMIKWINQGLGSVKEVKVSGREKFFIDSFVEQSEEFSKSMRFFNILNQIPRMFIETIVVATILITMLMIILKGEDSTTLLSTMALFAMGAFRLMPSINRMVGAITAIRFNMPALDVIHNELVGSNPLESISSYQHDKEENIQEKFFKNEIKMKNIFYRYPNQENYSIKDLSLKVPIGKSIAIIGSSGAGKTTIVDIILGILEPEKGEVLIDGVELKNILPIWKRKIGYIPQSIYLSDDSIRKNVAFGIKENEINDESVWRALKDAQLMNFVLELPNGLETNIGERGVRLSGGQRQRIGIARALYHNPEVLFLDEATSSLDNHTENEIMKAIDGLKGEKTIIIIAHRLSTIEKCDFVYELVNGKMQVKENSTC
ncbi:ABC transporter ATP-binding protein [Paenibacillus sp. BSR1-1]|uniref:ABC transporter ATP-binding protein n=1 Tax=Paenibacillus sp. BSR1-1 TaxID=3020845 RepID=UPI0025B2015C|nr:ABC transporter ATP-binding protein [Paenibacillus sp. BSR1-1]MDN3019198.1 ABC transporter ATP-binding protein [Paenibacillus sp. BSR1-1]